MNVVAQAQTRTLVVVHIGANLLAAAGDSTLNVRSKRFMRLWVEGKVVSL